MSPGNAAIDQLRHDGLAPRSTRPPLSSPIKNDSFLKSLRTFFNIKSDRVERKRFLTVTSPRPMWPTPATTNPKFRTSRTVGGKLISRPSSFQHVGHARDAVEAYALFSSEDVSELPRQDLHSVLQDVDRNHQGTLVYRPDVPVNVHLKLPASFRPSLQTVEKVSSTKVYFETYFNNLLKKPSRRADRNAELTALIDTCETEEQRAHLQKEWNRLETEHLRALRARIGISSFRKLKVIGHGAFGVVRLVEEKRSGQIYAMKCLKKVDMLRKGQEGHVRAERDVLAKASDSSRYIAKLEYSFQDTDYLYLVMEYLPGGDLLQLLIDQDVFTEEFARFYVAEMVNAIEEAHSLGYIHRDIKPDNFLFNAEGHIRLSDFGLSTDLNWDHDGQYFEQQRIDLLRRTGIDIIEGDTIDRRKGERVGKMYNSVEPVPNSHQMTWRNDRRRELAYSLVGTNSYMAPEVIGGAGYGFSCDWWSLGVILFEMVFGYPPFVAKTRHATRMKIMNYKQHLVFPSRPRVSNKVKDLIRRLICGREERLGSMKDSTSKAAKRGQAKFVGLSETECVQDIKDHPWFNGIEFGTLHLQNPPFQPRLSDPADTRYFEEISGEEVLQGGGVCAERARDILLRDRVHGKALLDIRKDLAFKGYTYRGKKQISPTQWSHLTKDEEGLEFFEAPTSEDTERGRAMSF